MDPHSDPKLTLTEWLSLENPPKFMRGRTFGGIIGYILVAIALLLAALFCAALVAAFVVVFQTIDPTSTAATPNFGVGALLTALLSAPFVIWRTLVAHQTLEHQRAALEVDKERNRLGIWNEKMTAASKDLAAWCDRTEVIWETDENGAQTNRRVLTTKVPDLVTRAAAIDTLYGLVVDDPQQADRIATLLSLYVRELTVKVGDQDPECPPEMMPETDDAKAINRWVSGLKPKRSDIQRAVQTLGRLRSISGVTLSDTAIDLRDANMQGFDLRGLNFGKGKWSGSHLTGASLSGASFEGADLVGMSLLGTLTPSLNLAKTNLTAAKMQVSVFGNLTLDGAQLTLCDLNGAAAGYVKARGAKDFSIVATGASISSINLQGARITDLSVFQSNTFINLDLTGASVSIGNFSIYPELLDHIPYIFGDGSNTITPWPDHWPKDILPDDDFNRAWRDWVAQNHPDVQQNLPEDVQTA